MGFVGGGGGGGGGVGALFPVLHRNAIVACSTNNALFVLQATIAAMDGKLGFEATAEDKLSKSVLETSD